MDNTNHEVELEIQYDAGISHAERSILEILEHEEKFERFMKANYSIHPGCDFLNRLQTAIKKIQNRG